jgi:hypothetical protein
VSTTGVTIQTRSAGSIKPGSMNFDEPTGAEVEPRQRLTAR